jgi:hypothetical protein
MQLMHTGHNFAYVRQMPLLLLLLPLLLLLLLPGSSASSDASCGRRCSQAARDASSSGIDDFAKLLSNCSACTVVYTAGIVMS